ncbi:ABC transporter permease [Smaragdicoccus niigatensis]|uniref:ABC transporter permease n=1 Tax=Smaragdicoccus niigatensis TaxID=359359 RepID=UPI00035F3ADA|nr:ABC transporter permease [Smaragdicoccus niigatensis]
MTVASPLDVFSTTLSPQPSTWRQYLALTERNVREVLFRGTWMYSVIAPAIFTVGYYLPMQWIMTKTNPGLNYAQFIMPIIVLQTASFTMAATAQQAAMERRGGFTERLYTMPVSRFAPLGANLTGGLLRSFIAMTAAIFYGHLIGFRMDGWAAWVTFYAFALCTSLVLSLGADVLGSLASHPTVVGQVLTLPTLIFGLFSTGFVPESGFPVWARPIVRNQPVSQLAICLRDLSHGHAHWDILRAGVIWIGVLFVIFTPLAIAVRSRKP